MQKQMAHSYTIKIYLLGVLIFFNIYALILVRQKTFREIISYLENQKIIGKKNNGELGFLFKWQTKVAKFFSLKKCLTTSIAFYSVLRRLGFNAKINISISNNEEFYSHSWVSVDNHVYLKKKKILLILLQLVKMENFVLSVSSEINGSSELQNNSLIKDFYNEKNIKASYSESDERQTFKSTKDLFIFSYSRVENKNFLKEKFKLQDIDCDADLIGKLFKIIGNKVFLYLKGSFSTVIYDKVKNCVYASSDHNNVYPIYYHMGKKGVTFVSDPRLLFLHNVIKKELDEEILFDYLVSGIPREGRTIYKNVMHVSGSSLAHFYKNIKETKIEKYFAFKSKFKTSSHSTQQTKELFLRTIASKLSLTDKNIASLLSGGLDSSSIISAIDYLNKKRG